MKIAESLTELIGNTPMIRIGENIFAKLEYFNPLGSIKDRAAYAMIVDGEERGVLTKDTTIIEPTSGNTGIGLAFVAASRGYKIILTMPDTMSVERRRLLAALGAELVLTEGRLGMKGAINKAEEIRKATPDSITLGQFENPANPEIHRKTTAPEIWNDTDGNVDFLVCGVGTGGTITGVGEYLKRKKSDVKVIAVEPKDSPVLSGGDAGPHKIQGIGAGFIPKVLNMDVINEVIQIANQEALDAQQELAKKQGLLVGISSGAAMAAAWCVASREENRGKNIVVVFPDTGERYLS